MHRGGLGSAGRIAAFPIGSAHLIRPFAAPRAAIVHCQPWAGRPSSTSPAAKFCPLAWHFKCFSRSQRSLFNSRTGNSRKARGKLPSKKTVLSLVLRDLNALSLVVPPVISTRSHSIEDFLQELGQRACTTSAISFTLSWSGKTEGLLISHTAPHPLNCSKLPSVALGSCFAISRTRQCEIRARPVNGK